MLVHFMSPSDDYNDVIVGFNANGDFSLFSDRHGVNIRPGHPKHPTFFTLNF